MAVSGRKLSDFQGSASLGSAEDIDLSCEPCLTIGQHVEAHGFCVDCHEYLCKTCFECHKRTKASRYHQLLDKDNVGKKAITIKDNNECTEKCSVHKKEIIKFFCSKHDALGCNDCMTMGHRTCKIDYIPDECANVGESEEYMRTIKNLNEKKKEVEYVVEKAEIRDKEIEKCHSGIMKEIFNFRKEIDDRLNQMQQKVQEEADEKKSSDKKLIQMVLDECTSISTDIKQLQSNMQAYKTSRQNGQLYISTKRACIKLKSDEVKKTDEKLAKTNMQYSFERNANLDKLLSKHNIFGKLNLSDNLITQVKKKTFDNITYKSDIEIRAKSDNDMCCITGCVFLAQNKFVVADINNCKLKVVDLLTKAVIEEKALGSKPWGIAAMPRDQIAVTMPGKREILLMTTASKLSAVKKIPVKGKCMGITHHQDHLYVVCRSPNSVLVLDTQGKIQNAISLNNDMFISPGYIVVSENSRHVYISDYGSGCVASITLQGEVSAVYKQDLYGPWGMLMLDDESLLVCSYANSTIHHITGDLKQCQAMIEHAQVPFSICYSQHHDEVYVGCDGNQLKVFSMK